MMGDLQGLIWVLHEFMIQTGFSADENYDTLFANAKVSSSTYRLSYHHPLAPERLTMACVSMQDNLIIHGVNHLVPNITLVIKISDYILSGQLKRHNELCQMFKDKFSHVLFQQILQATHPEALPPMLELPQEILIFIMRKCDAKDIVTLGRTCKRLNVLYKDDSIWSHLYRRLSKDTFHAKEFDISRSNGSLTWYDQVKWHYKKALEEKYEQKRFTYPREPWPYDPTIVPGYLHPAGSRPFFTPAAWPGHDQGSPTYFDIPGLRPLLPPHAYNYFNY